MTQPLKKRSEGRKKWVKGLDNSGNIEGISYAIVPQSRRECTLWVVEATGRLPAPSAGGWQCALPAA